MSTFPHWYVPNVSGSNEFRHVAIDTNYWKTFVHAPLATPAGDKPCPSLVGRKPEVHRLFAEHVAGAETWTPTEGRRRVVHEWPLEPPRPDNHWLDCLVGCVVAASVCGAKVGVEIKTKSPPSRIGLSELQRGRR